MKTKEITELILLLREKGIIDDSLLSVIASLPRDMFLLNLFKDLAYDDVALPIGYYQTISQPSAVGHMTQALELSDRMKVLEIGTGSGYQAAVLAKLCRRLYTVERYPELSKNAEQHFNKLGIVNITTRIGDGSLGWPEQAPFERIIVTAAAADIPEVLLEQLAEGGIMIVPVGLDLNDQHLVRIRRTAENIETDDLGPTRFVPLIAGEVLN
jgi:protein-L-isoaspartate(D-aspartate) O-methyltransferase